VIVDGRLTAWIGRGDRSLLIALPADDPDRSHVARALARQLVDLAHRAPDGSRGWLIEEINGGKAADDPLAPYLYEVGFAATARGLQLRVARRPPPRSADRREPSDTAEQNGEGSHIAEPENPRT
jgi:ATP-dependent Lhr-like helicase